MISTASPHNHELVKSRGADVVFDYKDPEVSEKIRKWVEEKGYKEGVQKAFDTISEQGKSDRCYLPRIKIAITHIFWTNRLDESYSESNAQWWRYHNTS